MVLASVLLPEPFGPMITCTSPLFIFKLSPFNISFSLSSIGLVYKSFISNINPPYK